MQAGALYLGFAWIALQVVIAVEDTLALPDWVDKLTLLLLSVGFPLALLLAWARESSEPSASDDSAQGTESTPDNSIAVIDKAGGEKPSVLVLPFSNLSDDADTDYLADGLTEDLISGLSQSRHLSLSARATSFSYKGTSPDVRALGRERGVSYVVDGSIRPFGEQIRINVQLVEAETERQLWSKRFDQPLDKIFDAQDEMTNRIAAALGAQLTNAEAERAARLKPDDLTTWQAIQRSLRVITYTFINKAEADAGVARLELAVDKNPEHVYARAALAWFLVMRAVNYCSDDLKSDWEKFVHHAGLAASMMGDDPYAMMLVGNAFVFGGQLEEGKAILERAISLNPGSADPYPGLAIAKGRLGDYEGAHATVRKARDLSPSGGFAVNYDWFDALNYSMAGDFKRAMPMFKAIAAAHPMFPVIHILLAIGHAMRGDSAAVKNAIANARRASSSLTLDYLRVIPYTHPDVQEHRGRIALIEPYWPEGDPGRGA